MREWQADFLADEIRLFLEQERACEESLALVFPGDDDVPEMVVV